MIEWAGWQLSPPLPTALPTSHPLLSFFAVARRRLCAVAVAMAARGGNETGPVEVRRSIYMCLEAKGRIRSLAALATALKKCDSDSDSDSAHAMPLAGYLVRRALEGDGEVYLPEDDATVSFDGTCELHGSRRQRVRVAFRYASAGARDEAMARARDDAVRAARAASADGGDAGGLSKAVDLGHVTSAIRDARDTRARVAEGERKVAAAREEFCAAAAAAAASQAAVKELEARASLARSSADAYGVSVAALKQSLQAEEARATAAEEVAATASSAVVGARAQLAQCEDAMKLRVRELDASNEELRRLREKQAELLGLRRQLLLFAEGIESAVAGDAGLPTLAAATAGDGDGEDDEEEDEEEGEEWVEA